jgi:hypothetical protein
MINLDLYMGFQNIMVDPTEEFLQIELQAPDVTRHNMHKGCIYRLIDERFCMDGSLS